MNRSPEATGERLKRTFDAMELSQADVCRETGLKENRLSQYVSGDRRITVDAITKLEDTFHIPLLAWIINGDPMALPAWLAAKVRKPTAA